MNFENPSEKLKVFGQSIENAIKNKNLKNFEYHEKIETFVRDVKIFVNFNLL